MKTIPYGESNFRRMILENKYYVDRTQYIRTLEAEGAPYLFFLRPRRFGKSLFVSMLNYYYGIQYKDEFQDIFGGLDIGQNPTPGANAYLVLKFDFSGIDTTDIMKAEKKFLSGCCTVC